LYNPAVRLLAGALAIVILAGSLGAQSPQDALRFEVASIKPALGSPLGAVPRAPDLFSRPNVTLEMLLVAAYDMPPHRIVGGPAWVTSDRFDVLAKASTRPAPGEMRVLVQGLLAERFGVKVHTEIRQLPTYDLVFARSDHRLGAHISPTNIDCMPFRTNQRPMNESPAIERGGRAIPRCGVNFRFSPNTGVVTPPLTGVPLTMLADYLEQKVNREVNDKTGLTGLFDIELTFVDETFVFMPGVARREADAPRLFTALTEQLGLKLESSSGPVDVLVIDAAHTPTSD
jgi:uncharacterized protein (TIGR03435 family)